MRLTPDPGTPVPLVAAAVLVVAEGLFMLGYGVLELLNVAGDRLVMGLTTSLFFAVYGAGLVVGAWAVTHGRQVARSPLVLAQLIQLGVAWSFWGTGTTVVAVVAAAPALLVLVGLLHPASLDALGRHR